ncbi:hypothetical protein OUZ56_004700 [Daphnia magna]|uniref:Uncharacterized protein n=1 Tax=Daphnia magna TaxID=35525 RepID=A0ABQ9YQU1_9CRUS|nr:hypothetical protein OUZ56_004700 [Daphnia magna]
MNIERQIGNRSIGFFFFYLWNGAEGDVEEQTLHRTDDSNDRLQNELALTRQKGSSFFIVSIYVQQRESKVFFIVPQLILRLWVVGLHSISSCELVFFKESLRYRDIEKFQPSRFYQLYAFIA